MKKEKPRCTKCDRFLPKNVADDDLCNFCAEEQCSECGKTVLRIDVLKTGRCAVCRLRERDPHAARQLEATSTVTKNQPTSAAAGKPKRRAGKQICTQCAKEYEVKWIRPSGECLHCFRKAAKQQKQQAEFERRQQEAGPQQSLFEVLTTGKHMANVICPHCQERGHVYQRSETQKTGFSTAKATFGILSGGLTIFGTGLAKKGRVRILECHNCGVAWQP